MQEKSPLYWNLDLELCRFIAQVLAEWLQKEPNGTPPSFTREEWIGQLEKVQKAMENYTQDSFLEVKTTEEAKEALHWIADNLEVLWD